jgi:hypothetical protein
MKTVMFAMCVCAGSAMAADTIYGLTGGNSLVMFNSATPGMVSAPVAISGLGMGESIRSIDFRPADGMLYGLGSSSRLYRIDTMTGAATNLSPSPFAVPLRSDNSSMDFNPTVDRIRVVGSTGQNLRLNPNTGGAVDGDGNPMNGIQGDGDLNYPGTTIIPNGAGVAYTNNFAGATSTVMFVIDGTAGTLTRTSQPNQGVLTTVGSLGFAVGAEVGFDISASTGAAWAVLGADTGMTTGLYSINIVSGRATFAGDIAAMGVTDIAIPIPAPGALAVLGMGGLLAARRRR